MDLFMPLIYFILANGLLVFISKRAFGKCIPITFMITAFNYFFSQVIFKTFMVGYIINLLLALVFIVIMIIYKVKDKQLLEFKNNFFSKGFYAFITAYICVYIFDFNRSFTVWDEFSHWGEMVKEMFRLDKFYSSDLSSLMVHKDYPPIIQLFEMFYAKLSGGYREAYLIRGLHLFSFTLFIPSICEEFTKFNKRKTLIKSILMIITVFLIILSFDQHGIINSIYIDYIMAITIAYLLASIVFEKNTLNNFSLINLSIGLSFLVLIKQIGLPLYLMILFMFFMDLLLKNKFKINKLFKNKNLFASLKVLVLLIIIPLAIWQGWSSYVAKLDVKQQFKLSDLKVMQLKGIMAGTVGEKWQNEAAFNYINAVKSRNLITTNIQLSYFQCLVLVLFLLYLVWKLDTKVFYKKQVPLIGLTLTLGSIGYAFVMLIMYVFSFGPTEGPLVASFDRYMDTYVLICMLLIYMLIVHISSKNRNEEKSLKVLLVICISLFLIQNPNSVAKCFPKLFKAPQNEFEMHANIIKAKTKENSKVYIIAQNSAGEYQFYIKYYMGGRRANDKYYTLEIDDKKIKDYEDYFNRNVKKYMKEFDYLYLAQIDKKFISKYGFIFDNSDIKAKNLYKINKNNGRLHLINN